VVLITIIAPTATKECTSQTGAKKEAQILTLRECLPGLSYGQHLWGRQGLLWKARLTLATRVQEKVAVRVNGHFRAIEPGEALPGGGKTQASDS
jgi:hypothetical protein